MSTPATLPEASPTVITVSKETLVPGRMMSLDAYRGFVMLLMISAGFYLARVAKAFPENGFLQFVGYQTEHVAWRGCTLWDLIQPSFMFLVGVALPFSIANRQGKGQSFVRLLLHALWRAFALIAIGIFLASTGQKKTDFNFMIVLSQIGLGYPFLWLLAWTKPRVQLITAVMLLAGYWILFAAYPAPGPGFNFEAIGVPADWQHFTGFEAHWEKSANVGAAFDRWFLNLFPREKEFVFNAGGYQTLNFIPSLATMIFGLLAGGLLLASKTPGQKLKWMLICGAGGLLLGAALDLAGICPMVKRIWTPSFAIYSGGWAFLMLAAFYWLIEMKNKRGWAFPLVVAGMNSIALYCMSMLMKPWIRERVKLHLGQDTFNMLGKAFTPMVEMIFIVVILWLVSFWMYRKKIFLRV